MFFSRLKHLIKKYRLCQKVKQYQAWLHIHPDALLLPSVSFSIQQSNGNYHISIGEKSIIGCNFIFESGTGEVKIGKRTYIGGGTNLISRSGIHIGNDVTIAWGVYVYDHNSHSLDWGSRVKDIERCFVDYHQCGNIIKNKDWSEVKTLPIHICDKAWIGFNAIILKGVTIGEGAVVGAGSVVTHDVPDWSVVAGNPAKVVKMLKKPEE